MNRRILILGSGGQIGAYLTDYLNKIGYEVLEFDIVNGLHHDMTEIPNAELHRQIMRSHFGFFLAFDDGGAHDVRMMLMLMDVFITMFMFMYLAGG